MKRWKILHYNWVSTALLVDYTLSLLLFLVTKLFITRTITHNSWQKQEYYKKKIHNAMLWRKWGSCRMGWKENYLYTFVLFVVCPPVTSKVLSFLKNELKSSRFEFHTDSQTDITHVKRVFCFTLFYFNFKLLLKMYSEWMRNEFVISTTERS